jgi:hypothetical protein
MERCILRKLRRSTRESSVMIRSTEEVRLFTVMAILSREKWFKTKRQAEANTLTRRKMRSRKESGRWTCDKANLWNSTIAKI